MNETPVEALIRHLERCHAELETIEKVVELLHDYHNPLAVDWALVGTWEHVADLLTEARQFIRNEEE